MQKAILKLFAVLFIFALAVQITTAHESDTFHVHKSVQFMTAGVHEFVFEAKRNATYYDNPQNNASKSPPGSHCEGTMISLMNSTNLPKGTHYEDFRVVVFYNENASAKQDYREHVNTSDAIVFSFSSTLSNENGIFITVLGNITYSTFIIFSFPFPYSLYTNGTIPTNEQNGCLKPSHELEKDHSSSQFDFEADDPYKFKIAVYYLGDEPVEVELLMDIGAIILSGGNDNTVQTPTAILGHSTSSTSVPLGQVIFTQYFGVAIGLMVAKRRLNTIRSTNAKQKCISRDRSATAMHKCIIL